MPGVMLGKASSTLASGGSGTVRQWSGSPGSETDSGVDVTAYNKFRAVASGKWCWLENDGDGWYVVQREQQAEGIQFTLASALATSDASQSGAHVTAYWSGSDPGSTVTLANKAIAAGGYQFSGASGAIGYAIWDDVLMVYRIIQLDCPS